MKTIGKRIVCAALVLALMSFALVGLAACNTKYPDEFEMPTGTKPSLQNRISEQDLAVIEAGLAQGADETAKKNAVIALYNVANSSRIEDNLSLMVQSTLMGILPFGGISEDYTFESDTPPVGIVNMRGFTLRNGQNWYNEFVAEMLENELSFIMAEMTTMVKVNYHLASDPDAYYFNIIKTSQVEADCDIVRFPYSSYKLIQQASKYDLDQYKDKANVLDAPNEIYNMKFVADIIADGATITHENGVYKVHFAVDPKADKALLEEWYRLPQKDMKEGNQEIKAYLRYICDFEVWDNGYAKSYVADYARDAGMGSGITLDKFNYLWNEDEIMDIISSDYRLDDYSILERQSMGLDSVDGYINYYINADIVKGKLQPLYIALIVIACVVAVAIAIVIVIEVLVRKGKLPKLAAKREAAKQKRLQKKEAKKAKKQGEATTDPLQPEDDQDEPSDSAVENSDNSGEIDENKGGDEIDEKDDDAE